MQYACETIELTKKLYKDKILDPSLEAMFAQLSMQNADSKCHILTDFDDYIDCLIYFGKKDEIMEIATAALQWSDAGFILHSGIVVGWRLDECLLGMSKCYEAGYITADQWVHFQKNLITCLASLKGATYRHGNSKIFAGALKMSNLAEAILLCNNVDILLKNWEQDYRTWLLGPKGKKHLKPKFLYMKRYLTPILFRTRIGRGSFYRGRIFRNAPKTSLFLHDFISRFCIKFFKDYTNTCHYLITIGKINEVVKILNYWFGKNDLNNIPANNLFSLIDILNRIDNETDGQYEKDKRLESLWQTVKFKLESIFYQGNLDFYKADRETHYQLDCQVDLLIAVYRSRYSSVMQNFSCDVLKVFNAFLLDGNMHSRLGMDGVSYCPDFKYSLLSFKLFYLFKLNNSCDYAEIRKLEASRFFEDR